MASKTEKSIVREERGRQGSVEFFVEFEDGIAWVHMNRPEKKNAISIGLAEEMVSLVDAWRRRWTRCGSSIRSTAAQKG